MAGQNHTGLFGLPEKDQERETKGALRKPLSSSVNPNHLLEKLKEIVFNEENESWKLSLCNFIF